MRPHWSKLSKPDDYGWVSTRARVNGCRLVVSQRTGGFKPDADNWSAEVYRRSSGLSIMVGRTSLREARRWCEGVAQW